MTVFWKKLTGLLRPDPVQTRFVTKHNERKTRTPADQSLSGSGSSLEQTAAVRAALPNLLQHLDARTLIDAPCGDLFWMQHVELPGVRYIGLDIVPELIKRNNSRFGSNGRVFLVRNLIDEPLPTGDVILCRDCLVHLTFAQGLAAINNFRRSGITYLLTTTFTARPTNTDLGERFWRPLNLQQPPYSFPAPLVLIDEGCTEAGGADKHLGLWRLADLVND